MIFLVDRMLGKLVVWLRIFGYDTVYAGDLKIPPKAEEDEFLLSFTKEEGRILVSRDKQLIDRAKSMHTDCYRVESNRPMDQIFELLSAYDIDINPKTIRCSLCNAKIRKIGEEEREIIKRRDYVPKKEGDFWICTGCGRVYWKGSHWKKMMENLLLLKDQNKLNTAKV
jgi:hypothetical protein